MKNICWIIFLSLTLISCGGVNQVVDTQSPDAAESLVIETLIPTNVIEGTDTLTVAKAAQQETMFPNLKALMTANQLGGNYRIVTSPGGLVATDTASQMYGPGNTKNIEWQSAFMPESARYISDQIATSVNFDGFLVRDGEIGLIENYPYDFRNGTKVAGKEWSVTPVELPYVNMRANMFINTEATEATALIGAGDNSNLTMTTFEEVGFWFRFYVPYRYNSDRTNRQHGIVKLAGATS